MQGRSLSRKKVKSTSKSIKLHPLKTQSMAKSKHSNNHNILKKPQIKRTAQQYYGTSPKTQIPSHSNKIQSKKLLKRATITTESTMPSLSNKILNELTGKINTLRDNISNKTKKILNMKLDKAFLDIQILNNQIQLQKAEKQEIGSHALESIYNINKSIQQTKAFISEINVNTDSLTSYQRFLMQALNEGTVCQSQMRVQLSEYSIKQKVSTQFMNAVEELRMLQLMIDKHNSVYDPYIAKLKKDIAAEKLSINQKQIELKKVNEQIFSQYGRNIHRNKSQTSSRVSKSSSVKRRNEIQMIYVGNLIAKNRSNIISDKRLLEKLDVTFSGLNIGFNQESGFEFKSLYADDQGQTYQGQIHSAVKSQVSINDSVVCDFNSLNKIIVQFNKKVNSIQFIFDNEPPKVFGVKQNNAERKQINVKDKMMRCIYSYWNQGLLVGLGFQYEKKKQIEAQKQYSIINQYFG